MIYEGVAYRIFDKLHSPVITLEADGTVKTWLGPRYEVWYLKFPHQEEPEKNVEELLRLRQVYSEYWEQGLLCYPRFCMEDTPKPVYMFSLEWWEENMESASTPPPYPGAAPIADIFLRWLSAIHNGPTRKVSVWMRSLDGSTTG